MTMGLFCYSLFNITAILIQYGYCNGVTLAVMLTPRELLI